MHRFSAALALGVTALVLVLAARGDEMSGDDKLRLLYSHRFTFTREGVPLVTVELMHGQTSVALSSDHGLRVLPDGDGGPEVDAGKTWTVTVENAKPAKVRWWTVVARQATDADVTLWKGRGYETKTFETGIVFGVEGDVIDSRELFLGVAPEADEAAATKSAKALSAKWKIDAFTHPEMVQRPEGTVVAHDDKSGAVVKNAGVVWFAPDAADGEAATVTVKDVLHGGGGSQTAAEKKETRLYHGRIYVTLGVDGTLTVVNAVPENQLLAGIVPSEIWPDSPPDALAAQAVAARDELLSKVGTRHFLDPFLLCSTQHCQVYGGVGPEDARATHAVEKTRGEVLLRDGGGLVEAYYSSDCGGFGEDNDHVWGTPPDPSLRGRLDSLGTDAKALTAFSGGITNDDVRAFLSSPADKTFCGRSKHAKTSYRWTVKLGPDQLDKLVAAEYPMIGPVKDLIPGARGVSGRILSLKIVGDHGAATVDGELHIRRLLGGLKSSMFVVRAEKGEAGKTFILDGGGFGHGVGLCQNGAIGMAESGYQYGKILEHYYPGSHLRKLY